MLGWVPSPWSGVRLGTEASARLCTDGHPMMWFLGDDRSWPKAPLSPLGLLSMEAAGVPQDFGDLTSGVLR